MEHAGPANRIGLQISPVRVSTVNVTPPGKQPLIKGIGEMLGDRISLTTVVLIGIIAWAVLFFIAHGAIVFLYLAIHLVTTGVFAFAMHRAEQRAHAKRNQPQQ